MQSDMERGVGVEKSCVMIKFYEKNVLLLRIHRRGLRSKVLFGMKIKLCLCVYIKRMFKNSEKLTYDPFLECRMPTQGMSFC